MKLEMGRSVTAEALHLIVAEASKSGVIEESERAIISERCAACRPAGAQ